MYNEDDFLYGIMTEKLWNQKLEFRGQYAT